MSTFYEERRPRPAPSLSRFLVFALAVVIAVTGLTARLFYLQIVDGGRLATLATSIASGPDALAKQDK